MLDLSKDTLEFTGYLSGWMDSLATGSSAELFADPAKVAVISVDLVKGFCTIGPLSSPRVNAIVPAVAQLFTLAHGKGVRALAFAQDTHEPDAKEFAAWPPHCVRGTEESETAEELKALPFFDEISVFEKNSINSAEFTGLDAWIADRPGLSTFIVAGDCTDLCVYQLAMYLRIQANARQMDRRVIVPVNCVDTYDLPTAEALKLKATPHPGELMHEVFLYHMALNGIEIVKAIE